MLVLLVLFVFGTLASFVVDTIWWLRPSVNKYEKGGLRVHEHYHFGLELLIIAIILMKAAVSYTSLEQALSNVAAIMVGAGFGFIMAEWRQIVEPKAKGIVLGHPFSYGSNHFIPSTIIGVILTGIVVGLFVGCILL